MYVLYMYVYIYMCVYIPYTWFIVMKTDEVLSADGLLEVAVIFHTPAHEALSLGRSSAKVKQIGLYESNMNQMNL